MTGAGAGAGAVTGAGAPPLVEIEQVTLLDTEPDLLHGAYLDRPQPGSQAASDGYALDLHGWVVGKRAQADAVELLDDDLLVRRVPVEIEREGVAEAFPDVERASASGFYATVNALNLRPRFELLVRARLEDKTRVPLAIVRGRRTELRSTFVPRLRPLMVTTLGRTGSTALVRLLESHPSVVAYRPFEYEPRVGTYWMDVFRALADPAAYRRQVAPTGPLAKHWWLGEEPPLPRATRDPEIDAWLEGDSVRELASLCQGRVDAFYGRVAEASGRPSATYFAEKFRADRAPDTVWELYSDARELVLVRDFRDMVSSMLAFNAKRGMAGFRRYQVESDREYVLQNVRNSVSAVVRSWQRRSERAHLVRYEDLVLSPSETLAGIFSYLSLELPGDVVERAIETLAKPSPESEGHRTAPSAESSIGRWKKDLADDVRKACEEALAEALAVFGYRG